MRLATCAVLAAVAGITLFNPSPASAQSLDSLLADFERYATTFKGYGNGEIPPSCASGASALGDFALANVGDTLLLGLLGGALVFSRVRRNA